MAEVRILIAAAATLCGGIFLLMGYSAARRRRLSGATSGRFGLFSAYGVLFLIAGIVVWWRGPAVHDRGLLSDSASSAADSEIAVTDTLPEEAPLVNQNRPKRAHTPAAEMRDAHGESLSVVRHREGPRFASTTDMPRAQLAHPEHATTTAGTPRGAVLIEDRIYNAVARAFDHVEQLFQRYATPVHTAGIEVLPHARAISTDRRFPPIEFQSANGAELTPQSRDRVRRLARQLLHKSDAERIEIRAFVDGKHPAPLATMLSLARAVAVRDLLVEEGVQARRLVAVPMDDEQNRFRPAETWVMFVVHP